MKLLVGKIVIVAFILFAFTYHAEAQRHQNKHKKKVVVNNRKAGKKVVRKTKLVRVPRTKVVYRTPNRKVIRYKTIPSKKVVLVNHRNIKYYYSGGFYYRMHNGYYVRTAPVFGLRVKVLPVGYRVFAWNKRKYFYHNGAYYTTQNNEYEVVAPEPGVVIDEIPEGAEQVEIADESYYEYNNVLYQKNKTNNGEAYEVAAVVE